MKKLKYFLVGLLSVSFLAALLIGCGSDSPDELIVGRMKKSAGGNYSDRLIDIDILLYGDLILHTPELEIPHPLMTERRFVMDPLAEIASDVVHPVLGKRLGEL